MNRSPNSASIIGPVLPTPVSRCQRWILLILGVFVPLFAFGWLVENLRNRGGLDWDSSALVLVHKHDSASLDGILALVAQSGDFRMVLVLTVFCAIGLLILRRRREERFLARCVVGAVAIIVAVKAAFYHDQARLWQSIAPQPDISSPSAHSMTSFTLFLGMIVIAWPTRWRWVTVILGASYIILVASSQVYLGIHQVSDVLSAWALALAWVVSLYLMHGIPWKEFTRKSLPLVLTLLAAGVAILAGYITFAR